MRVIGGRLGGRRLIAPSGATTRPTSDRVREAIFNILAAPPPGTRVLDAFAGSGAMGLEALSRGAERACFVDSSRAAVQCLRRNVEALGAISTSTIHCGDALALVRRWSAGAARSAAGEGRFRWIFIDPPYRSELAAGMLAVLGGPAGPGMLDPDAVVVVEHDRRNQPAKSYGCLVKTDHRRYGDTEVSFYRIAGQPSDQDDPHE